MGKEYEAPPVDRREILRYSGVRGSAPEVESLLDDCLAELSGRLTYRVCFAEYPVFVKENTVMLGDIRVVSSDLARRLEGCDRALIFAATVGHEIDRVIARYGRISPARALMVQAIGTERIEALCDAFEKEISEGQSRGGRQTRKRFSPGYGDIPLTLQREIFASLACTGRIGVSLNESLLMSPSKSVTAIIGIGK